MTTWSKWKRALQKLGVPEQPRAERHNATGLAAQYGLGSSFTSAEVRNISSSGVCLTTEKRLQTGELITLILREEGKLDDGSELQFSVDARVARQGENGIGLSFVLPPG